MLLAALTLTIMAGLLNGCYAAPVKSISWSTDAIWLIFSLLTFGIMPWLTIVLLSPKVGVIATHLPSSTLFLLILCGILFGIGMAVFTYSLRYLGIAVSFMLNIAAGTIIGSLLPLLLLNAHKFIGTVGKVEMFALVLFLMGLMLTTVGAKVRDKHLKVNHAYKGHFAIGIILGMLSGLLCSAQGFVYSYTLPVIKTIGAHFALPPLAVVNFPWCIIYSAALVPYFIFFLLKWLQRPPKKQQPSLKETIANTRRILIMVICYYGSLLLFSQSGLLLGNLGSVIAWPLFMTIIVLVSNGWGMVQGEWREANRTAIMTNLSGIIFLVLAIVFLSLDGFLNLQ